jgi:hypothetical protein
VSAPAEAGGRREGVDTVVGLMAAAAIFLSVLAITNFDLSIGGTHFEARPVRIGVAAILLALVAAGIGGRNQRLATAAVAISGVGWLLSMVIAVLTQRPLF